MIKRLRSEDTLPRSNDFLLECVCRTFVCVVVFFTFDAFDESVFDNFFLFFLLSKGADVVENLELAKPEQAIKTECRTKDKYASWNLAVVFYII
jgi:hypothetical protein